MDNWLVDLLTNKDFTNIIQYVLIFLTNIITFIFTRKKYKADIKHKEAHTLSDTFVLYKNIIDDLETRVTILQKKITEMELDFEVIKKENEKLRDENEFLKNKCK